MFKKLTPIMMYFYAYVILAIIVSALVFSIDDSNDRYINVVITLSNILCVGFVAIRSTWNYPIGVIATATYGYMAMKWGFNGDMMLNFLFYLPMQFIGWIYWARKPKDGDASVKASYLSNRNRIIIIVGIIICILIYGKFLGNIKHYLNVVANWESSAGDWYDLFTYFHDKVTKPRMPYVDSTTTVLSIFATFLMIQCKFEQWILWIVIDIISTTMWGFTNLPTFSMWALLLINACVACVLWYKNAVRDDNNDEKHNKWDGSSNIVDLTK